jgi:hypothetical protein
MLIHSYLFVHTTDKSITNLLSYFHFHWDRSFPHKFYFTCDDCDILQILDANFCPVPRVNCIFVSCVAQPADSRFRRNYRSQWKNNSYLYIRGFPRWYVEKTIKINNCQKYMFISLIQTKLDCIHDRYLFISFV